MSLVLSEQQIAVLNGRTCPYCKGVPEYVDSVVVYGTSYGMIYLCRKCDAYCGVHKGTNVALGRLANKELREYKKQAHRYFDVIWKEKHVSRGEAYQRLSEYLQIPSEYTHIGMFSVDTCKKVIDWSMMILNDLRRLDMDFGIEVNRPHYER